VVVPAQSGDDLWGQVARVASPGGLATPSDDAAARACRGNLGLWPMQIQGRDQYIDKYNHNKLTLTTDVISAVCCTGFYLFPLYSFYCRRQITGIGARMCVYKSTGSLNRHIIVSLSIGSALRCAAELPGAAIVNGSVRNHE